MPCVFDNKQYIPASGLNDYKRDVNKAKQLLQGGELGRDQG